MSVPRDRMDSQARNGAEQDSHAAVHQGIQALAGAAAKMGSAKTEPHPDLIAALQSLHGGVQDLHGRLDQMQQGDPGQDPGQADYSNMPDPSDWVQNDPGGAASYAEAILQRFAEMMTDQAAAPQGDPMMEPGPAVGGGGTSY
jgi:hypothetical protein